MKQQQHFSYDFIQVCVCSFDCCCNCWVFIFLWMSPISMNIETTKQMSIKWSSIALWNRTDGADDNLKFQFNSKLIIPSTFRIWSEIVKSDVILESLVSKQNLTTQNKNIYIHQHLTTNGHPWSNQISTNDLWFTFVLLIYIFNTRNTKNIFILLNFQ